jgi:hypothetical protein
VPTSHITAHHLTRTRLFCAGLLPLAIITYFVFNSRKNAAMDGLDPQLVRASRAIAAQSVLVKGNVRCGAGRELCRLSAASDFTPFEMWSDAQVRPLWRAETPRAISYGSAGGVAIVAKHPGSTEVLSRDTNFGHEALGWVAPWTRVRELLVLEQMLVDTRSADVRTAESTDGSGNREIRLTITDAQHPPVSPALTYFGSDTVREYVIDAATLQIRRVRLFSGTGRERLLMLDATIEYDLLPEMAFLIPAEIAAATAGPAGS